MSNKSNSLTTKRFVIRKSLLGKNVQITFTNKKGDTITYNYIRFLLFKYRYLNKKDIINIEVKCCHYYTPRPPALENANPQPGLHAHIPILSICFRVLFVCKSNTIIHR